MLTAEGLSVRLGGVSVIEGITLSMTGGEMIGVLGPNGAGKSTFARSLVGLVPRAAGRVTLDAQDIEGIPAAALARRIAYVPQAYAVHWPITVARLVGLGRLPHLGPFSRITAIDRAAIEQAMRDTGTTHLANRTATELSGGELARVMLARALSTEAKALIADEPLTSLDPSHQLEIMALLRAHAESGALVIVVLHDLSVAARFCDRLLMIDHGRLIGDGRPADVLTDAMLAKVYGITAWRGTAGGKPLLVPLDQVKDAPADPA